MSLLRDANQHYLTLMSPAVRLIHRALHDVSKHHFNGHQFGTCVDIGGGASRYRDLFQCKTFYSMDIASRPGTDVLGDIVAMPMRSDCVDLILCTEVLEHIRDTAEALQEMRRVLQPGGHLIITVPMLFGEHDVMDYYRWTRMGLRTALENVALEVVDVRSRGGYFSAMGGLVSQLPAVFLPPPVSGWTASNGTGNTLRLLLRTAINAPFQLAGSVIGLADGLDRKQEHTAGLIALARKPS
jgi:SAM-dependent methyltransferase